MVDFFVHFFVSLGFLWGCFFVGYFVAGPALPEESDV